MAGEAELLKAAHQVRLKAHAPYSKFFVGAAVLADDGQVYLGCNVENAAYPEGCCAEAVALGAMVVGGGRRVVAIAVAGGHAGPPGPCLPCGGCRQKIAEFSTDETVVLTGGEDGVSDRRLARDLLPARFVLNP
jgi:cytidine deaminase